MEKKSKTAKKADVGSFLGQLSSFNNSLKLYHWHVTGPGSYAAHMALDEALEELTETLDGIVETTYALVGDVTIVIPETKLPKDIIKHVTGCYQSIRKERVLYAESLTESLLDEYEQTLVQLLYRLKRLS